MSPFCRGTIPTTSPKSIPVRPVGFWSCSEKIGLGVFFYSPPLTINICKTRYTFYAERGYLPHCSTTDWLGTSVPRGPAPGPRWGLCPQTPTFSRYALGLISDQLSEQRRCKTIYLLRVY